ncbi:hypothetical protein XHV734_0417 [Xanthomonas hortorum pv. vitians]|nr:hypothetical protein XHV734_0417 [Xanthomonas hortorum pv. vitians]
MFQERLPRRSERVVRWARTARSEPQCTNGTCRFRASAAPARRLHRSFVSFSKTHSLLAALCQIDFAPVSDRSYQLNPNPRG